MSKCIGTLKDKENGKDNEKTLEEQSKPGPRKHQPPAIHKSQKPSD